MGGVSLSIVTSIVDSSKRWALIELKGWSAGERSSEGSPMLGSVRWSGMFGGRKELRGEGFE